MERSRFLNDLAAQIDYCAKRSPAFLAALAAIRAEVERGASWWPRLEGAWAGRAFQTDFEAPFLLLAAVNFCATKAGASVFAGKEPGKAAVKFLESAPREFWDCLSKARLQLTEPDRAVGWLLVGCAAFWTRNTPFHLVDMGTSAGLTLIGDYLPRDWRLARPDGSSAPEPPHWKDAPYPVLSRLGLDARPRDVGDPDDRLWLLAAVFPEDAARREKLEAACELFLRLKREAAGPRLETCAFLDMPGRIREKVKPDSEHGLLVYSSKATEFLSDEDYSLLGRRLEETLAPWEDRGLWVELEVPRAGRPERKAYELRVHRLVKGRLETKVLARFGSVPREITILPGWDFLAPQGPPRPPRVTLEEGPKQLEPGLYRFEAGTRTKPS